MPTVSVNLDTTQYVKVNNGFDPLLLQAHRDSVRIVVNNIKPTLSNSVFHIIKSGDDPLHFASLDVDVWALSLSNESSLIVTQTPVVPVLLHDADGNPIDSINGNLNVHTADVHTSVVNAFFHRDTGVNDALSSAATAGDTQVVLVDAGGFTVGGYVELFGVSKEATFPQIVSISTNTITIDRPLENDYIAGVVVVEVEINMNPIATLFAPVSYKLTPELNQTLHMWTFVIGMVHNSAADDAKFGGINALTNGVVLRYYNGLADKFFTLANWKANYDIKLDLFSLVYTDRAGGSSDFGTNGLGDLRGQTGAISELIGANGDYLEILIQDDLSGLFRFQIKAQGHIEGQS